MRPPYQQHGPSGHAMAHQQHGQQPGTNNSALGQHQLHVQPGTSAQSYQMNHNSSAGAVGAFQSRKSSAQRGGAVTGQSHTGSNSVFSGTLKKHAGLTNASISHQAATAGGARTRNPPSHQQLLPSRPMSQTQDPSLQKQRNAGAPGTKPGGLAQRNKNVQSTRLLAVQGQSQSVAALHASSISAVAEQSFSSKAAALQQQIRRRDHASVNSQQIAPNQISSVVTGMMRQAPQQIIAGPAPGPLPRQGRRPGGTQGPRRSRPLEPLAAGQAQLMHEYLVQCTVKEADLQKDLSSFFGPRIYCAIRFTTRQLTVRQGDEVLRSAQRLAQLQWHELEFDGLPQARRSKSEVNGGGKEDDSSQGSSAYHVIEKVTECKQGQQPQWEETFTFGYQKLTKACMKLLRKKKPQHAPEITQNEQRLELTVFAKGVIFSDEKIGKVTLNIDDSERGFQTNWVQMMNENDEEVGKLLVHIEITRDTTQRQLRLIEKHLDMQDQVPESSAVNRKSLAAAPGMNQDLTEDRGMPLRNHEQVLLLNEKEQQIPLREPQSNHQQSQLHQAAIVGNNFQQPQQPTPQNLHAAHGSNYTQIVHQQIGPLASGNNNGSTNNTGLQSQQTQETHITHQTQNSALLIGGYLQPQEAPSRVRAQNKQVSAMFARQGPGLVDRNAASLKHKKVKGQAEAAPPSIFYDANNGKQNVKPKQALRRAHHQQHEYGEYDDEEDGYSDYDEEDDEGWQMNPAQLSRKEGFDEEDDYDEEDDGDDDEYDYEDEEDSFSNNNQGQRQTAPQEVTQIIGTDGNLQTHCQEDEDDEEQADEDDEEDDEEDDPDDILALPSYAVASNQFYQQPPVKKQNRGQANKAQRGKKAPKVRYQRVKVQGGTVVRGSYSREPAALPGAPQAPAHDSNVTGLSMLGMGMAVVETQHIHEDEEENSEDGLIAAVDHVVESHYSGDGPAQTHGQVTTDARTSKRATATKETSAINEGGTISQSQHATGLASTQQYEESNLPSGGNEEQKRNEAGFFSKYQAQHHSTSAPPGHMQQMPKKTFKQQQKVRSRFQEEVAQSQTNLHHADDESNINDVSEDDKEDHHQALSHGARSSSMNDFARKKKQAVGAGAAQVHIQQRPQTAQTTLAGGANSQHHGGQQVLRGSYSTQKIGMFGNRLSDSRNKQQLQQLYTQQQHVAALDEEQMGRYHTGSGVGGRQGLTPTAAQAQMTRAGLDNFRTVNLQQQPNSVQSGPPASLPRGPSAQMLGHGAQQRATRGVARNQRGPNYAQQQEIELGSHTIHDSTQSHKQRSVYQGGSKVRKGNKGIVRKGVGPVSYTPGAGPSHAGNPGELPGAPGGSIMVGSNSLHRASGQVIEAVNGGASHMTRGQSHEARSENLRKRQGPSNNGVGGLALGKAHNNSYMVQMDANQSIEPHVGTAMQHLSGDTMQQHVHHSTNSVFSQTKKRQGFKQRQHEQLQRAPLPQKGDQLGTVQYARTQHTPSHSNFAQPVAYQTTNTATITNSQGGAILSQGEPLVTSVHGQLAVHSGYSRPIPTQPVGTHHLQTMTSQPRFHSQHTQALHTEQAQVQETNLQNYYDEFGEELEALGEIDDEDLLDADEDALDHLNYNQQATNVNNGIISQSQTETVDSGISATHGTSLAGGGMGDSGTADPLGHHHQQHSTHRMSKKSRKKRRQPSHERHFVSNGKTRGEFVLTRINGNNSIQQQNMRAARHEPPGQATRFNGSSYQNQHQKALMHNRSNLTDKNMLDSQGIMSAGGVAIESNSLEQETFSMQQDTFQGQTEGIDGAMRGPQTIDIVNDSSLPPMYPDDMMQQNYAGQQLPGGRQSAHNLHSHAVSNHLSQLPVDVRPTSSSASGSSKMNVYQKNAKQVKMLNRRAGTGASSEQAQGQLQFKPQKPNVVARSQMLVHNPTQQLNQAPQLKKSEYYFQAPYQQQFYGNTTNQMDGQYQQHGSMVMQNGGSKSFQQPMHGPGAVMSQNYVGESAGTAGDVLDRAKSQSLIQQLNTYQEHRDYDMEAPMQQYLHTEALPDQVLSVSSKQQQQILQTINSQNSRGLSHEVTLNQIKNKVREQLLKVEEKKKELKKDRAKLEEDRKALDARQRDLDAQQKKMKERKQKLKKQKMMAKNETRRVKVLLGQFTELLKTQAVASVESIDGECRDRLVYQGVEMSEQLSSIQTMLRILLNDRREMKEEPSSARSPKRKSKARTGKHSSSDSDDGDSDVDDSSVSSSVSPLVSSARKGSKNKKARKLLETMVAEQQQKMAEMSSQLAKLQSQVASNTAAQEQVHIESRPALNATPIVKVNLAAKVNPTQTQEEQKDDVAWPQKPSSSSQSEFVFDPDPDFLLKINNNIRENNQRLGPVDEPAEAEEPSTPKERPVFQPQFQQVYTPIEQEPIIDKDVLQQQSVEAREELISCGSDVQIEEADEEEMMKAGQAARQDEQNMGAGANCDRLMMVTREQQLTAPVNQIILGGVATTSSLLAVPEERRFLVGVDQVCNAMNAGGALHSQTLQRQAHLQQHANTDRNQAGASELLLLEGQPLFQGTQGDFMVNYQREDGGRSQQWLHTGHVVGDSAHVQTQPYAQQHGHALMGNDEGASSNSQIPSSQMSAFQSIQQRLAQRIGGLGGNTTHQQMYAGAMPAALTSSHDQLRVNGPPPPWAANSSNHALGASASLTPSPSMGPSPAAMFPKRDNQQPKLQNIDNYGMAIEAMAAGSTMHNVVAPNAHEQEQDQVTPRQENNDMSPKNEEAAKPRIDEDEILRLIHETQEAPEWSESQSAFYDGSSSQTDTFHSRPQGMSNALRILQARQRRGDQNGASHGPTDMHQSRPSVILGEGGQIYDEPKRAVYGIKKAKNDF